MVANLSILLALVALPAAGADSVPLAPRSLELRCDTTLIDVGEISWSWTLLRGFDRKPGGKRSVSWMGREAEAMLLLAGEGERTLRVTARAARRGIRLTALVNGREIGSRSFPRARKTREWTLPAEAVRLGPNLLTLRASAATGGPGELPRRAVAVDSIGVSSEAVCTDPETILQPVGAETPLRLPAGSVLVTPVRIPPSPRIGLGVSGEAGATLRVFHFGSGGIREVAEIPFQGAERVRRDLELGTCCEATSGLVLVVGGSAPVGVDEWTLTADDRRWAWRRALGLVLPETLAVFALAILVLAVTCSPLRLPGARLAPWLDAGLLAALAILVRFAFLHFYPEPGWTDDAWEYLHRAGLLVEGQAGFLTDQSWHRWQSWIRPPGFYLFLAGILGPLQGGLNLVVRFQALFSGLGAGFVYLAAYPLFGRGAALASGLLFALHAESIVTASRILTEPLYLLLVLAGLAAVCRLAGRVSRGPALAAGLLLGAAALVRSAALQYVLLAALAVLAVHGWRAAWRAASLMVGCAALVVLPWCVRNSVIYGAPMMIDDLAVANLLQFSPIDRYVPVSDLDMESPEGRDRYYYRLKRANQDRALTRRRGEITRAVLAEKARHPVRALQKVGRNLRGFLGLFPENYFAVIHRESRPARAALVIDLMNAQYLLLMILGSVGILTRIGDRRVWPLLLWLLYNAAAINLLFHPAYRYRFQVLPVLMIFSGVVVASALARLRGACRRGRGQPAAGGGG